ncbi:MAG: hypothetical protein K2K02_05625 [Ruminococcus sp.]|nr:hypothetical protein [Ruminococcus sp.]MDE6678501.1 hypothetical protein [Ruminococcus sp.]
MKKTELLQKTIIITVLLLSVISFLVLPESVAVQWDSDGVSNHIPKITAVLIPLVISLFGIASWKYSSVHYNVNIKTSDNLQKIHSVIWGTVSLIGIIINILFMIMNGKPFIL